MGNEDVVYSPQKSNRVNEDDHKKKKKKEVVASDIVDAENHIHRPPVVIEGRPVRQLKPSQYLSSPYVSFWDRLFYASDMGFLDEARRPNDARWTIMPLSFFGAFEMFQWAGSATGNPFDPLDGCKSWLEVDRIIDFVRFEELMGCILVEIEYWNHMGLPVQKASITVTDVMDVPQQERMYGECGVFMLMFMEQLVSGRPIGISMEPVVAATH
ncbi:hypothetical protein Lser_V15G44460 [Lactuca serriola]